MDIKIQPPKKETSLGELIAWCRTLAAEINVIVDILEAEILRAKEEKKEE